ncbi:TPA: hypothetical protein RJD83_002633 [Legionella pneumophila]|nr:hypothetical protein [Legionella pneumophila]
MKKERLINLLTSTVLAFLPFATEAFTVINDHVYNISMQINDSGCNPIGIIYQGMKKELNLETLSTFCKNTFPCQVRFSTRLNCLETKVLTLVNKNAEITESYIFPNPKEDPMFISISSDKIRFS